MTSLSQMVPQVGARAPKLVRLSYPLAELARRVEHQALTRLEVVELITAGAVHAKAAEDCIHRINDLQGLLDGLAPNSLPDDDEVSFYLLYKPDNWVQVDCRFKRCMPETKASLHIELHQGWAWRPHSLMASRVFPQGQARPSRLPR